MSANRNSSSHSSKRFVRPLASGLFLVCLSTAQCHPAAAQSTKTVSHQDASGANTPSFYGNEFQLQVPGKPFSATEERVTSLRTRDSKVEDRCVTLTYIQRDSQGRVRTDRETFTYDAQGVVTERRSAFVADPVAHTILILDPERKTAMEMPWNPPNADDARAESATSTTDNMQLKVESLGVRSIEGLLVDGSRRDLTIPVKSYLYYRAVAVSIESWVSRDLDVPVWTRSETSTGEISTTTLKDVVRAEPNSTLFQLPSDYTLTSPGTDTVFAMAR
jgi:hypothetical protein